jgi:hypothetical protein
VDRFANRVFLASVMVEPNASARAIAAFEDSIADGTNFTVNANKPLAGCPRASNILPVCKERK